MTDYVEGLYGFLLALVVILVVILDDDDEDSDEADKDSQERANLRKQFRRRRNA